MRIVSFEKDGRVRVGFQLADTISPLPYENALVFLASGREGLREAERIQAEASRSGTAVQASQVRLLAPVPRPGKIVCIGMNYRDHCQELGREIPKNPIIFAKYANAVTAPGQPIVHPWQTSQLDCEAELGVIIGSRARNVAPAEAIEAVAGYTCFNDVSARDIQFGDKQWLRGKTFDTFAPMGPCLVTKDEIPDPQNLKIELRLNDEVLQLSNTAHMIFGVAELISFLSEIFPLDPGDVIATGTPAGVGVFRKPPRFTKPGDRVRITIERVGVLENPVVAS